VPSPQRKPNLRRYHQQVWLPENWAAMVLEFVNELRQKEVDLTNHGAVELMEDRRGIIPLPTMPELLHPANTLIELYEVCNEFGEPTGVVQKAVIRVHNLDENLDYSYVIARDGYIVSAWANDKNDNHRLKHTDYYQPPEQAA
jgi:hypothetical protein